MAINIACDVLALGRMDDSQEVLLQPLSQDSLPPPIIPSYGIPSYHHTIILYLILGVTSWPLEYKHL